jgi:hypothetical protein
MSKRNLKDLVIAVDFDGTCVKHAFPRVGEDIGAVPVLKKLVEAGAKLILWTMRDKGSLFNAVQWFKQNEITLYGVQRNPIQHEWTSSPKCYASLFIDDAALGAPLIYEDGEKPYIDWKKVEEMLF